VFISQDYTGILYFITINSETKTTSQVQSGKPVSHSSSQSHMENISPAISTGGNISMNFVFITDNKLASNTRRKCEAQVCIGYKRLLYFSHC